MCVCINYAYFSSCAVVVHRRLGDGCLYAFVEEGEEREDKGLLASRDLEVFMNFNTEKRMKRETEELWEKQESYQPRSLT